MMNLYPSEIRSNIQTHFGTLFTLTPIEYPPAPFNEDKKDEWVGLHIDMGNSQSVMKGEGTTTRHTGLIHITINVKLLRNGNDYPYANKRVYEIADEVLKVMERKRLNNSAVVTRAGYMDTEDIVDKKTGRISFAVVTIPFVVT